MEIPLLNDIHNSLTLFRYSISKLLISPLKIELKPACELSKILISSSS